MQAYRTTQEENPENRLKNFRIEHVKVSLRDEFSIFKICLYFHAVNLFVETFEMLLSCFSSKSNLAFTERRRE